MMVCTELVDKKRLYKHKFRVREYRKLQEQIDNITQLLEKPSGMKLSDMPRSQNPFDKTGNLISIKMDKENKQKSLKQLIERDQSQIESIIEKMSTLPENPKGPMNSELQDIIKFFFLYDYSWKEIITLLSPEDDGFIDMTESNLRKLHKWNGQALAKFIRCQERG